MKEYIYKAKKLGALSQEIRNKIENKKNLTFFQKVKKAFSS